MPTIKHTSSHTVLKICIIAAIVIVIGGSLTFAMTWKNVGFHNDFFITWLGSFALCVVCIAPIGSTISVLLNKAVNYSLPRASALNRNLTFGLIMAILMESIMAVVTTFKIYGLINISKFVGFWLASLVAALPIGILFSIILTLIIKPRLEIFWSK